MNKFRPLKKLDIIEESNENSEIFMSQLTRNENLMSYNAIKSSLRRKNEEDKDEVECLRGFTRLPKYLKRLDEEFTTTSKISNIDSKSDNELTDRYTILKNYENNRNQDKGNFKVNSSLSNCNFSSIFDTLLIRDFKQVSLQKIVNEFENFGEIKKHKYDDKNCVLILEYFNAVEALQAYKNHDPFVADKNKKISVDMIKSDEFQLNNYIDRNTLGNKPNILTINSPSVSHYHQIIDFCFSW